VYNLRMRIELESHAVVIILIPFHIIIIIIIIIISSSSFLIIIKWMELKFSIFSGNGRSYWCYLAFKENVF
jgi:hypothetical protein